MKKIIIFLTIVMMVAIAALWSPAITPEKVTSHQGLYWGLVTPDSAALPWGRVRQVIHDSLNAHDGRLSDSSHVYYFANAHGDSAWVYYLGAHGGHLWYFGDSLILSSSSYIGVKAAESLLASIGSVHKVRDSVRKAQDTANLALSTANAKADTNTVRSGLAAKLDTNGIAANSKLLQGKDTTALWNAKTLQGKDTTAMWKHAGTDSALRQKGDTGIFSGAVGIGTAIPSATVDVKDTTLAHSGALAGTALNVSQTWKTSGAPSAAVINALDSGSSAASKLLSCRLGGIPMFEVTKTGRNNVWGASSGGFYFAAIASDNAQLGFDMIDLSGAPVAKGTSAARFVKNADALTLHYYNGQTVGNALGGAAGVGYALNLLTGGVAIDTGFNRSTEKLFVKGNALVSDTLRAAVIPTPVETAKTLQGKDTTAIHIYAGRDSAKVQVGDTGVFTNGRSPTSAASGQNSWAGGLNDTASGKASFVGGGSVNRASGDSSAVVGGKRNRATAAYAFVGGGDLNTASGAQSAIAGGSSGTASGQYSAVGGGLSNTSGYLCAVAGGYTNAASGTAAVIGGGSNNVAKGNYSAIAGGDANLDSAYGGVALGCSLRVKAADSGAVVIGAGHGSGRIVSSGKWSTTLGSDSTVVLGTMRVARPAKVDSGLTVGSLAFTAPDSTLSLRADGVAARPVGYFSAGEFDHNNNNSWMGIWRGVALSSGGNSMVIPTSPQHPGIYSLNSSTSANSGFYFTTWAYAYCLAGSEVADFVIRGESLSGTSAWAGFLDFYAYTGGRPGTGVYYELSGTTLRGFTSTASTRDSTASTYSITKLRWYRLNVTLSSAATRAYFAVYDSVNTRVFYDSVSTQIPTGATGHGIAATNSGTTAYPLVDVDYMSIWIPRALAGRATR
jgi:hypothetical protein